MIRGIIFDFGGVLMKTVDPSGRREWETRLNLPPGELERIVHGSDLWIEAQRGAIMPDAYWTGIGERLNVSGGELATLRADYFRGDQLDQALVALIGTLRREGYQVALLSNDALTLEEKLRGLHLYDLFDAVIISAQVGVMKPDAAAYRAVARALGLSTPECIFLDDNTANVDGALAVGMHAVLYRAGMDAEAAIRQVIAAQSRPVDTVIFDFGNVLDIPEDWEAWRAHRDALAAQYGLTGDALWSLVYTSEPWQQVKIGQITYDEYIDAIFRPLGVEHPDAQIELMRGFFTGRDRIHPLMLDILHTLKGRCRLALLSNAYQRDVDAWMEAVGLTGMFEVAISSAVVGIAKPEPDIYRLTLNRLNIEADQALFVDDLTRNTDAAESIGLPCIVFESPEQLRAALERRGLLQRQTQ